MCHKVLKEHVKKCAETYNRFFWADDVGQRREWLYSGISRFATDVLTPRAREGAKIVAS